MPGAARRVCRATPTTRRVAVARGLLPSLNNHTLQLPASQLEPPLSPQIIIICGQPEQRQAASRHCDSTSAAGRAR